MVTTGLVHVAGEVTTEAYVEIPRIVRDTVLHIGYDSSTKGFDGESCGVEVSIGQQSPTSPRAWTPPTRTAPAATTRSTSRAGDQGLMFGYACEDTPELMPLPIFLAHRLSERLTAVRKAGEVLYLRPDGKTQVTIEYDGDRPVRLDTVVLSTQHAADVSLDDLLTPTSSTTSSARSSRSSPSTAPTSTSPRTAPHQPHRPLRDRRPDG